MHENVNLHFQMYSSESAISKGHRLYLFYLCIDISKGTYLIVGKMLAYLIIHGEQDSRPAFFSEAFYKMLVTQEIDEKCIQNKYMKHINKVIMTIIKY